MKDLCAACGADLRKLAEKSAENKGQKNVKPMGSANVQAVHNLPELRISEKEAERSAQEEIRRLHNVRKLVLLVDLDQAKIKNKNFQNIYQIWSKLF